MRNVLGQECPVSLERFKRYNEMKYIGCKIQRPGDLKPKGIKSTYNAEKLPFNETYERLWKLINTLR